jgi:hypothetical protein
MALTYQRRDVAVELATEHPAICELCDVVALAPWLEGPEWNDLMLATVAERWQSAFWEQVTPFELVTEPRSRGRMKPEIAERVLATPRARS